MRLPVLVTLTLMGSSLLPTTAAAEPTRSFPLPESTPAAAPQPTERAYSPPAATTPQAVQPSPYYAYPQTSHPPGYGAQSYTPGTAPPSYSFQRPAQGPTADRPVEEPHESDADRGPSSVSLSLSLLHLIGPMAEGTLEIRPFDHVGIAGVLGRGNFTVDGDDYSVWEYGGQLNIYSSAFDGLAITGEVFRFSGEGEPEPGVKGTGRGTLLSGLIGYKGITSGGFTIVIQGGFTRVLAEVTAEHPQLGSASQDASTWLPMANLNLGWTL